MSKQPIDPPFLDHEHRPMFNQYRSKLARLYSRADMAGVMEASEDIPVNLRDIYVPLRIAEKDIPKITDSSQVDEIEGQSIESALLKHRFLAISGLPGSGKTTLTQYLASQLSETELNDCNRQLGRQLVIPIILRDLDFSIVDSFHGLWTQWRERITQQLDMELIADFFDFYLKRHWAVIIFDGLDEVGEAVNEKLIRWIDDWLAEYPPYDNYGKASFFCILTGRPSGFLNHIGYERHFSKRYLQPFNTEQIEHYVRNWYRVRYPQDTVTQQSRATDFIEKLRQYRGLAELKHRPIYLAMLAYVAETYGELPVSRTLAYSKMVDAYVHQLELLKQFKEKRNLIPPTNWTYDDKIRVLEELAFSMHTQAEQTVDKNRNAGKDDGQMQILVHRNQLLEAIKTIVAELLLNSIPAKDAENLLNYFVARTGLLIETKQDYFQFSHLTFQEFLTAKRIYRKLSKRNPIKYLQEQLFDKIGKTGWHEVVLLYFGIDTLNSGEEHDYLLQACLKVDNPDHERFLIDLLVTTDHTLNNPTVLAYLNTLVFFWVTGESSKESLYFHLAQVIDHNLNHPDYAQTVVEFLIVLLDNPLEIPFGQLIQPVHDIDSIEGDEFLSDQLDKRNQPDPIKILHVGFFLTNFREQAPTAVHLERYCHQVAKIDKPRFSLMLANYYPVKKQLRPKIAKSIFQSLPITLFVNLGMQDRRGFFLEPGLTGLARTVQELALTGWHSQLFKLSTSEKSSSEKNASTSKIPMTKDMVRAMVTGINMARARARARGMDMAMDMARDMTRDMARDMGMARDMARAMDMARDMGMAGGLARAMDMDMARNMARDMARAMDMVMARDMARDIARAMDRDMARAINMAMDMARDIAYKSTGHAAKKFLSQLLLIYSESWLLILFWLSEKISRHLKLDLPQSYRAYQQLHDQIMDTPSAIQFFKNKHGAEVTKEREQEIIEWLDSPGSPRYMLQTVLKNPNIDQTFNEEKALQVYHTHLKTFIKEFQSEKS